MQGAAMQKAQHHRGMLSATHAQARNEACVNNNRAGVTAKALGNLKHLVPYAFDASL
jgi:hypothetical protein